MQKPTPVALLDLTDGYPEPEYLRFAEAYVFGSFRSSALSPEKRAMFPLYPEEREIDGVRILVDVEEDRRYSFFNMMARGTGTVRYAWAIPDNKSLNMIAEYGPIVEIGCGTGYWAMLLRGRGVDVIAYDETPTVGDHMNNYHSRAMGQIRATAWTGVLKGTHEAAALHPDRALFLCWPPYDSPMAYDTLIAYTGNTLIYIGEGNGGCTGDDVFHHTLEDHWTETRSASIPQWDGMHDGLTVYTRNSK